MKYPLCFPVYKHRKTTLLDRLNELDDLPENVYCFMYDFDKENYNLDDYKDIKNLTIVEVPGEYKTSMKMRVFIQNFITEKGFNKFWMLDDDVSSYQHIWNENAKSHTERAQLTKACEIMEKISDRDNYAIIGPTMCQTAFYWTEKWDNCRKGSFPCILCLFDNKQLLEKGVRYTGDTNVNEDLEIWINTRRAGLTACTCTGVELKLDEKVSGKNSWVGGDKDLIILAGNYLKFGNDYKIFWHKNEQTCGHTGRGKWYLKPRVWNDDVKKECQDFIDGKIKREDFIEYLKTLRNKKDWN